MTRLTNIFQSACANPCTFAQSLQGYDFGATVCSWESHKACKCAILVQQFVLRYGSILKLWSCLSFPWYGPAVSEAQMSHGKRSTLTWLATNKCPSRKLTLRVQVPNDRILTQKLYYNYYYPNRKYLIMGYMDPLGYLYEVMNLNERNGGAAAPASGNSCVALLKSSTCGNVLRSWKCSPP